MQQITGNLLLALWVFPLVTLLAVVRKLAIGSYRDNNYTATSGLSSLGKQLANSKSFKFTIVFNSLLIATTLITIALSLYQWSIYQYRPEGFLFSSLISAPLLLTFFLIGILYVTMTPQGLAWWDANVIIFRYTGFHGRRSYLREQIDTLIEENEEGVDNPYRAYLTLERLYTHEFDIGESTRDIIEQIAPDYHKEFKTKLLDSSNNFRFSYFFLFLALLIGFLSICFFVLGSFIHLPSYNNSLVTDTLLGITLSFLLMWMIFSSLEIPILRPASYLAMDSEKDVEDDSQSSS